MKKIILSTFILSSIFFSVFTYADGNQILTKHVWKNVPNFYFDNKLFKASSISDRFYGCTFNNDDYECNYIPNKQELQTLIERFNSVRPSILQLLENAILKFQHDVQLMLKISDQLELKYGKNNLLSQFYRKLVVSDDLSIQFKIRKIIYYEALDTRTDEFFHSELALIEARDLLSEDSKVFLKLKELQWIVSNPNTSFENKKIEYSNALRYNSETQIIFRSLETIRRAIVSLEYPNYEDILIHELNLSSILKLNNCEDERTDLNTPIFKTRNFGEKIPQLLVKKYDENLDLDHIRNLSLDPILDQTTIEKIVFGGKNGNTILTVICEESDDDDNLPVEYNSSTHSLKVSYSTHFTGLTSGTPGTTNPIIPFLYESTYKRSTLKDILKVMKLKQGNVQN